MDFTGWGKAMGRKGESGSAEWRPRADGVDGQRTGARKSMVTDPPGSTVVGGG